MTRLIISHIITALVGVFSVHYYQFLKAHDLQRGDIIPGCCALVAAVLIVAFTQAVAALRAQHAQTRIAILRQRKLTDMTGRVELDAE